MQASLTPRMAHTSTYIAKLDDDEDDDEPNGKGDPLFLRRNSVQFPVPIPASMALGYRQRRRDGAFSPHTHTAQLRDCMRTEQLETAGRVTGERMRGRKSSWREAAEMRAQQRREAPVDHPSATAAFSPRSGLAPTYGRPPPMGTPRRFVSTPKSSPNQATAHHIAHTTTPASSSSAAFEPNNRDVKPDEHFIPLDSSRGGGESRRRRGSAPNWFVPATVASPSSTSSSGAFCRPRGSIPVSSRGHSTNHAFGHWQVRRTNK